MRLQVKEVEACLSNVSVYPQYNWTCWETDMCVAPLFFSLVPKTAKLQTKISAISPGNDIKGRHSNNIAPFHPMYILKTYIIYAKNTGIIATQASKSSCNRIIFTLQNAVESTERSGMSERSSFGQGPLLTWWPVISPAPAWGHKEIKLQRATGNARPFPVTEQNDVVEL